MLQYTCYKLSKGDKVMASYEFDGISTEQYNPQDRENFTEPYDGTLVEKDTFTVELDSKEVQLHIYIEDTDMSEYEDTQDHVITLGVVPSFNSLTAEHQEDILNQFMPEDRELMLQDTSALIQDALSYGFGIPLHTVTISNPDNVEHAINSAIAVRSGVSGLIGFELDRPRNLIGNTGWDLLSDYCEGVDSVQLALSRFN